MSNDEWDVWPDEDSPDITMTRGERVALTVLAESGVPMTHGDVARESGLRPGTIRNRAVRWRREGWVTMDEEAVLVRMAITVDGRRALSSVGSKSDAVAQQVERDTALEEAERKIGALERQLASEQENVATLEHEVASLKARLTELPDRLQDVLENATQYEGNGLELWRVRLSVQRWLHRNDKQANGMLSSLYLVTLGDPPTLKEIAESLES